MVDTTLFKNEKIIVVFNKYYALSYIFIGLFCIFAGQNGIFRILIQKA
jgi:hypothetical protein